jgi:hypothetical protein
MYDQSEWEELQRHNDIFARWNYECQTELERWHLFLESKYKNSQDWREIDECNTNSSR